MSDDSYRAMLEQRFGVTSSGDLRLAQLLELVAYLKEGLGWEEKPKRRGGKDSHGHPRNLNSKHPGGRQALLSKIEALLAEKGRVEGHHVPWSYAAGILKRQGGPARLEWATDEQLRGVVSALTRDAKRKGRRTA